MPADLISLLLSSLITSFTPPLPSESAVGFNIGFSPATAGTGVFYAFGDNQLNLGVFYGIGTDDPDLTNVLAGLTYNRTLTDWGLFAATGLVLTYTARTAPASPDPEIPDAPGNGMAWQGTRVDDPYLLFELGEAYWFGSREQFGIHADAGASAELDSDGRNPWSPIFGAGVSYRFKLN